MDEKQSGENEEIIIPEEENGFEDEERSLPLSARREREDHLPAEPIAPPEPEPEPGHEYRQMPSGNAVNVRSLLEGAAAIGLTLGLAFIADYAPIASIFGIMLLPIPTAILVFRHGFINGLIATAVIAVLAFFLFVLTLGLQVVVQYCAIGIFLGYCFRQFKGPLFTLGITTLIAAGGTLIVLMLSMVISSLPLSEMLLQIEEMVAGNTALMNDQGLLNLVPEGMSIEEYNAYLTDFVIRLLPAALIIISMLMATFCYLIATAILRRLNYDIPKLPPYSQWRMDWRWSWGVIIGLLAYLLGNYLQITWIYDLGINILYIFSPVLFVCGFAFIVWLLKLEGCSPFAKILLILPFILYLNIAFIVTMFIAVFEPLVDLRGKINQARQISRRR